VEEQKRNQANQLARECMVQALIKLLDTKPLSEISVTEIANKAGVSRMTYYRNYNSKEEIFTTYLHDIFDTFRQDTFTAEQQGGFFQKYENILYCFHFFEKHKDFILSLYKSNMADLLLQVLTEYITETYYSEDKGIVYYYELQALTGSLYTLYLTWLLRGCQESGEKMAMIINNIYKQVL